MLGLPRSRTSYQQYVDWFWSPIASKPLYLSSDHRGSRIYCNQRPGLDCCTIHRWVSCNSQNFNFIFEWKCFTAGLWWYSKPDIAIRPATGAGTSCSPASYRLLVTLYWLPLYRRASVPRILPSSSWSGDFTLYSLLSWVGLPILLHQRQSEA